MAKKDAAGTSQNIDRKNSEEKEPSINERNDDAKENGLTEVKNANASGVGSMGRNDEEKIGDGSKQITDV